MISNSMMMFSIKFMFGVFCFIANYSLTCHSFSKVVVPSVYKEWEAHKPDWTRESFQHKYNYSVFLYQKLNPSLPNYIATNRGTEAGVYLRYIVDHYDSFPDVAVFTHAVPEEHSPDWLDRVKCIRPNATYYSLNDESWLCRDPSLWHHLNDNVALMEQCWRDVLQTAWGYNSSSDEEFIQRLPPGKNVKMCATCCQQFLLSRGMVQAKPLRVWKQLLETIGVRNECHKGPPDFSSLYFKTIHLKYDESSPESLPHNNYGQLFQGITMEHLAHVVYGQQPLISPEPTMRAICDQFLPSTDCPGSPCDESVIDKPLAWQSVKHTAKNNKHFVNDARPPAEPSRGDYKPQQIKPKINPHDPQLQHHMQHTRPGNQHQH